jgi:hypothetical protein
MTTTKTKTSVAVALITLSAAGAAAIIISGIRANWNTSPTHNTVTNISQVTVPVATTESSNEVNTSCNIDSGATSNAPAKYHATFTAYGKMENGVKKTKVVSTGQVYTMIGSGFNGNAIYKLIDTVCDSDWVSGKAQCSYGADQGQGRGAIGTATGEIVDNEAGATTKNLLVNVAIGTNSMQKPYNKCTKYTALTGLTPAPNPTPIPDPTPTPTPIPVGGLYGEKSFTLDSNYQPTGWSNGTPETVSVKMVGKYLDNSYQVSLVANGKYAIYGWDGQKMSWALADLACDTGFITSTSTDDLGITVGGPAKCAFSTNVGSGELSAKIRTVNGAKKLIFYGAVYSKLQNGTLRTKPLPVYSVVMATQ